MKKKVITAIIALVLVITTAFATYWATMSNLKISVNEEANGALVECFNQSWYYETEEIK